MTPWLLTALLFGPTATPAIQTEDLQTQTASVPTPSGSSKRVDDDMPKGWKRFSYGAKVRVFPLRMFENKPYTADRSSNQRWSYTSTDQSHRLGLGAVAEYGLSAKWAVSGELLFHSVEFQKVTTHYLISDSTKVTTFTETTKVRYWDVPLTVRYWGIGRDGWRSHVTLSGGPVLRNAANIRSGTVFQYQAGNTGYNELRDEPAKRNLIGALAGVGYRLVDDSGFKVTPEIRFTRWAGRTYASDSTQSPKNQIEAGLAVTF